jgi:hypothetical protein
VQTLGISDSNSRDESRLKGLFWPSVESGVDVEYLAIQGYWVCTVVAVFSLAILIAQQPVIAVITFLFFYLGGVGVREHSRFAAVVVFIFYAIDTLLSLKILISSPGMIVLRAIIMALLLSNLRATWIASRWKSDAEEATLPVRLSDTLTDKFANNWPTWLWPKLRVVYYIFSIGVLLLIIVSVGALALGNTRR